MLTVCLPQAKKSGPNHKEKGRNAEEVGLKSVLEGGFVTTAVTVAAIGRNRVQSIGLDLGLGRR
jgi:hypothetical protein